MGQPLSNTFVDLKLQIIRFQVCLQLPKTFFSVLYVLLRPMNVCILCPIFSMTCIVWTWSKQDLFFCYCVGAVSINKFYSTKTIKIFNKNIFKILFWSIFTIYFKDCFPFAWQSDVSAGKKVTNLAVNPRFDIGRQVIQIVVKLPVLQWAIDVVTHRGFSRWVWRMWERIPSHIVVCLAALME